MKQLIGMLTFVLLVSFYNGYSQTQITGGEVYGTWTLAGSPYLIEGNVVVPNSQTLTIEPGVIIDFTGHYYMQVKGALKAIGQENDSIEFSVSDTTGYAANEHVGWGSIWIDSNDPSNDSTILSHCIISFSKDAPGISVYDSHKVRISNCRISNNTKTYGAGIYCVKGTIVIDSNFISYNNAYGGGGILFDDSDGVISGNRIMYNSGGGIFCGQGDVSILNNVISWNEAIDGAGGITLGTYNNIEIFNNIVSYNKSINRGGGIHCSDLFNSNLCLVNNTVVGNESQNGAGGFSCSALNVVVTNCVFWNNIGGEINKPGTFSPNLEVQYCAVEGGYQGPGNVNLNSANGNEEGPGFVDPSINDFSILNASILSNSGATTPEYYYGNETLSRIDINGVNRWLDGAPSIGAYENEFIGSLFLISGTIYDVDGITPLEGIWICGTYSDQNGDFNLNVGEGTSRRIVPYHNSLVYLPKYISDINSDLAGYDFFAQGEYVSCEITEPTLWTKSESPYFLNCNMVIQENQKLTIEPGVEVISTEHGSITVRGQLIASGTELDSIRFTAIDTIGFSVLTHKGWQGIVISNNALKPTFFEYCNIEYVNKVDAYGTNGALSISNNSRVRVNHCCFKRNSGTTGGALNTYDQSDVIIENTVFHNNKAESGGAVYSRSKNSVLVSECEIANNKATDGGGLYFSGAAGITIQNTRIYKNEATRGGGVYGKYFNSLLLNNIIFENSAALGSGIYCIASNLTILNNTIVKNHADYSGSIYLLNSPDAKILNSVIWNSTDREIYLNNTNSLLIQYSAIHLGYEGVGNVSLSGMNDEPDGPNFTDPTTNNFGLSRASPLIDAGASNLFDYPATIDVAPQFDISGISRWIGGIPDIGAYEYDRSPYPYIIEGTIYARDSVTPIPGVWVNGVMSNSEGGYTLQMNDLDSIVVAPFCDTAIFVSKTLEINNQSLADINFYAFGTIVSCDNEFPAIWERSKSPYFIRCNLTIPENQLLTIESGVEAYFEYQAGLYIRGSLIASGNQEDSIRFSYASTSAFSKGKPENWRGIYTDHTPIIEDSVILDYCIIEDVHGGNNASIEIRATDNFRISNSLITKNQSQDGGISCHWVDDAVINNNTIINNQGDNSGGLNISVSDAKVMNNIIRNNTTGSFGGGITIADCNPILINNLIAHNSVDGIGGSGIYLQTADAILINNTIVNNHSASGGGIWCRSGSDPTIINSVLWGNSVEQLYVEGSFPSLVSCGIEQGYEGENNINLDSDNLSATGPNFRNPDEGNYSLWWNSPLVDAGYQDTILPLLSTEDLAGNPRIENDQVDIGAYEFFHMYSINVEISGNGSVSPLDTTIFKDDTLTFIILPEDSFELSQVLYNQVEVTTELEQKNESFFFTVYGIDSNSHLYVSFEKVLGIPEETIPAISIYPNPIELNSSIEIHARFEEDLQLEIYSLTGSKLFSTTFIESIIFSPWEFTNSQGMFIYKLMDTKLNTIQKGLLLVK